MAIAFDTAVEAVRTDTSDPMTWTHTPSGTPRAIVVALVHGTSATNHVSTVTYGGVSMSRIVRATDTATEPGAAELWFLGSGIPTGAQTVSADLTSGTTDDIHGVSMSFTAVTDTIVVDSDSVSENASNPSVTLQYGGRTCMAVAALYGGGADPTAFAENGDCTRVHDADLGAFYSAVCRQTTAGSSDFAIGGTASSDDVAYVALAVSEMDTRTPTVGSLTAVGVAAAFVLGTFLTPLVGALTFTPQTAIPVLLNIRPASGELYFGLDLNTNVTPAVGALDATGVAPLNGRGIVSTVGSLSAAGLAGSNVQGLLRSPTVGSLTATGLQPTNNQGLLGSAGLLTLTGVEPTVSQGSGGASASRTPTVGGLTLAGGAGTASAATLLTPSVGELFVGLITQDTRTPTVAALTWTGYAPTVQPGFGGGTNTDRTPAGGELVLGLQPEGQPNTASLALTGLAPTIQLTNTSRTPLVGGLSLAGSTVMIGGSLAAITPEAGTLFFGISNDLTALPATGTLTLTGKPANPPDNTDLTPPSGVLLLTRPTSTTSTPVVGTLTLTGKQANPPANTDLTPGVGILRLSRGLEVAVGTLALTGGAPDILINNVGNRNVQPQRGSLTVTGLAPTMLTPIPTGSVTLQGYQPVVQIQTISNINVQPGRGSLLGTGLAPDLLTAVPTGTLTAQGYQPIVQIQPVTVTQPGTGSLTLAGVAPTLRTVIPTGALTFDGGQPLLQLSNGFAFITQPNTGSLTLSGVAPAVQTVIPTGELAFDGEQPLLQISSGLVLSVEIMPNPGTLFLTPFINLNGRGMVVNAGSLSLAGVAAEPTQNNYDILTLAGSLVLVGNLAVQPTGAPTGIMQEGCGSVNGTAVEGCAGITGTAQEGCATVANPITAEV